MQTPTRIAMIETREQTPSLPSLPGRGFFALSQAIASLRRRPTAGSFTLFRAV